MFEEVYDGKNRKNCFEKNSIFALSKIIFMAEKNNDHEPVNEANENKECEGSKPFFVHTLTDDGVTSDYADAKEAYEGR